MDQYLKETILLNYQDESIQNLVKNRGWRYLSDKDKILNIYNFVRDEIMFGYNEDDEILASNVIIDGQGQCNTKGILFMALLRSVGIPCRFHGFTIDKKLQKGAITGIWYFLAPKNIIHSWIEIFYKDAWLNIEGFILDLKYLTALQKTFEDCKTDFCGFGVSTKNFLKPEVYWNENNTYIQKEGINQDLGIFDDPDSFFRIHRQELNKIKKILYKNFVRKLMNKNVSRIRASKVS
jgi:hypothetical protein